MSQLKVNTIRHTSASSDAITLASDGTATAKITNNLSNRNLIINGAMNVAQRGTSSTSAGYTTIDRLSHQLGNTDEAPTFSQADVASGTTPYQKGFRKSHKITNGNQTSGAGTSDYIYTRYKMEAQDIANSGWNYLSASSYITLSFWVKSSVAQNFYGYLKTSDGTSQNYPFETGSLSADTWTKITKTIPGNSNLQFDNDNGNGLEISPIRAFDGTDRTASMSLNTWGTYSSSSRTPDQTSTWYTTNDATLEITGLQLEVGDVATDFEHRSYGDELRRCQRYYQVLVEGTGKYFGGAGAWYAASAAYQPIMLESEMRAAPSAEFATGTDYYTVTTTSNDQTQRPAAWSTPHKRGGSLYYQGGQYDLSNATAGHAFFVSTNNASAKIAFSAEL